MIASGRIQMCCGEWGMLLVQKQLNLEIEKWQKRSVSLTFLLRGVFEFNSQDKNARELIETDKIKILIFFLSSIFKK